MKKIVEKRLSKFEESFSQYEDFFEEWKKWERNRFTELDVYISDRDESLNLIQINHLIEISDTFKGIAKELAPKFLQIVERLEESSQLISEYEHDAPNRYEYFAAKAERSFEEQIKDLLDFSDFYRGYARAYDPNRKLSEVFDNVDSLFQHLEAG